MQELGTVESLKGKKAKVIIKRHAACGECGACMVGKKKLTMETIAQNSIHAQPGDNVLVEMRFASVLTATFIAYGIPLIFFIIGILVGWFIAPSLHIDQVLCAFLLGLALTVLVYVGIYFLEKRGFFNFKYQPTITALAPEPTLKEKVEAQKKVS